jgi:hypothetical protein
MEVSKEKRTIAKDNRREKREIRTEEDRHEKFQFGTNPMKQTSFERELAMKEAKERQDARIKYVLGTQGRDGGYTGSEDDKKYYDLY